MFTLLATLLTTALPDLPVRVPADKTYQGQLFEFGEQVLIQGVVEGDLLLVASQTVVSGRIHGNVIVCGGQLALEPGAQIKGKLSTLGAMVANLSGQTPQGGTIQLLPHARSQVSPPGFSLRLGWFLVKFLLAYLVFLGLFFLFPQQLRDAAFEISLSPARVLLAGLLLAFFFLCLFFLCLLKLSSAWGVPLLLVSSAALFLALLFGQAGLLFQLTQSLERRSRGRLSTPACMWFAVLAVVGGSQVPLLGPMLELVVVLASLGTVLLSRFGTNRSWFTRKRKVWAAD
jgi:hypothetical protein